MRKPLIWVLGLWGVGGQLSCGGSDGDAGSSCTVVTEGGATEVRCDDGTTATLEMIPEANDTERDISRPALV